MALPYRSIRFYLTLSVFVASLECFTSHPALGGADSSGVSKTNGIKRQLSIPRLATDSGSINPVRATIAGVAIGGSLATIHYFQQRAWWLGPQSPLWFKADLGYALNLDKLGHVYGTYVLSRAFGYTLSWCGFNSSKSTIYGAGLAAGYQIILEVQDGYRNALGFDPVDAFSDILGAVYPVLQESYPVLRNFTMKYSYLPSQNWSKIDGQRFFIDDYEGMALWISMDPHFLLSPRLASALPAWLGVSFGCTVRDIDWHGVGTRVYYLTLDYNLSKIETSDFLHAVFTAIDFVHLPAPGLQFDSGKVSFGIIYR